MCLYDVAVTGIKSCKINTVFYVLLVLITLNLCPPVELWGSNSSKQRRQTLA